MNPPILFGATSVEIIPFHKNARPASPETGSRKGYIRMSDDPILLILSNSEYSQTIEKALRDQNGYRVAVARDRESAEVQLRNAHPALILFSDHLEDQISLEFAARLIDRYPQFPFVLLTESSSMSLLKEAFHLGFTDYLLLPAETDDILRVVRRILQRRRFWLESMQDEAIRLSIYLEAERDKLETILNYIEEGMIVVDFDGRVVLINPRAQSIFRIENQNLIGKPVQSVLLNTDLIEVLEEERKVPRQVEISLEDGRVFNAQVTPIPEIGQAVTMQDITQLKELDRIKSDFVSTVSHDLRSPLTAILGYVELIDRVGPVNTQQSEFIRRIQANVHGITSLINDLLDLGKIEAGFDSRKEVIPFYAIVHYAVDSLKNRALEKSQNIVLNVADNMPQVLGNPVRLRQMLSNLIGNAIKYSPDGGEIHVRARTEAGQAVLQVSDNGPGIPAVDQPYIFDKFYRAGNVPNDIPGTGLGLAIVKSIVEQHQGRIWVDSTPGSGTTFTIVLTLAEKEL